LATLLDVGQRRPAECSAFCDLALGQARRAPDAGQPLPEFPVLRLDLTTSRVVIHRNILVDVAILGNLYDSVFDRALDRPQGGDDARRKDHAR
jgi:hypothetical protein